MAVIIAAIAMGMAVTVVVARAVAVAVAVLFGPGPVRMRMAVRAPDRCGGAAGRRAVGWHGRWRFAVEVPVLSQLSPSANLGAEGERRGQNSEEDRRRKRVRTTGMRRGMQRA